MKAKGKKNSTNDLSAVMAFTEWLQGKHNYIFIADGFGDGDDECLCVAEGNKDTLINIVANGVYQHKDLHHIIFKAATAVVNHKFKQMKERGIDFKEIERDIEDMMLGDDL